MQIFTKLQNAGGFMVIKIVNFCSCYEQLFDWSNYICYSQNTENEQAPKA